MTDILGTSMVGARMQPTLSNLTESLDAARLASRHGDAEETARAFERLLATSLVKEMRRSLWDGFFGDSTGADTFDAWFDEHLGNALAQDGALELASMVRVSLERKQELHGGVAQ